MYQQEFSSDLHRQSTSGTNHSPHSFKLVKIFRFFFFFFETDFNWKLYIHVYSYVFWNFAGIPIKQWKSHRSVDFPRLDFTDPKCKPDDVISCLNVVSLYVFSRLAIECLVNELKITKTCFFLPSVWSDEADKSTNLNWISKITLHAIRPSTPRHRCTAYERN